MLYRVRRIEIFKLPHWQKVIESADGLPNLDAAYTFFLLHVALTSTSIDYK